MLDFSFSEMLLVAVVAILVIGPKDLPRVLVMAGRWAGRGKAMMRELRHGMDEMVREADLKDMEARWADQNARIMAEHPPLAEPQDMQAAASDDTPAIKPAALPAAKPENAP